MTNDGKSKKTDKQSGAAGDAKTAKPWQFQPGKSGNPAGRPRGFDFRRIVAERIAKEGLTVEDAVWAVFKAAFQQAGKGDIQAAKLIIDRLCDSDPQRLEVEHTNVAPSVTPPKTLAEVQAWADRLASLAGGRVVGRVKLGPLPPIHTNGNGSTNGNGTPAT